MWLGDLMRIKLIIAILFVLLLPATSLGQGRHTDKLLAKNYIRRYRGLNDHRLRLSDDYRDRYLGRYRGLISVMNSGKTEAADFRGNQYDYKNRIIPRYQKYYNHYYKFPKWYWHYRGPKYEYHKSSLLRRYYSSDDYDDDITVEEKSTAARITRSPATKVVNP